MPTIYKPRKKQTKTGNNYDETRRKVYKSAHWKRLRAIKFTNNPLCEICLREGRTTPAEDIHHIRSFMQTDDEALRYELAYDYDNLLSLCKQCHQKIHNGVRQ